MSGVYYHGAILNEGSLKISNSYIGNNSGGKGAGISNYGALEINNSTISGNTTTENGGGIYVESGSADAVSINNSTIFNNSAAQGGGLYIDSSTTAQVTIYNSILSSNSSSGSGPNCLGVVNSANKNIVNNANNCVMPGGSYTSADPQLIGIYGVGSPKYIPIANTSPAKDAGDFLTCLEEDQRGVSRPQGVGCDIGAYEYTTPGSAATFGISEGTNQQTITLVPFSKPLVVYVTDSSGSPVSGVDVTFTAPASGASGTFADSNTNITTVSTDGGGLAVSSGFTANSQSGAYTVNATASSLPGSVNFNLTNVSWYVTPSGDNDNDCMTPTTACGSIMGPTSKDLFRDGDIIYVQEGVYPGNMLINKSINISGGWNSTFSAQSGYSTISGSGIGALIVNSGSTGSVLLDRFIITNGYGSGAGISQRSGELTVTRSIIRGNHAGQNWNGGGIYLDLDSTLNLINSTVSGNSAGVDGGGIFNQGGILNIENSTIAHNHAPGTGGIAFSGPITGNVSLVNSIVAHNAGNEPNCDSITSANHSLIHNTTGCTISSGSNNLLNVDPLISPLFGEGYYAILSGSPAIDSGDLANCPANDQRGVSRPIGAGCDIGSLEYSGDGTIPAYILSYSGTPQYLERGGIAPLNFKALVLDENFGSVPNATVTFTSPVFRPKRHLQRQWNKYNLCSHRCKRACNSRCIYSKPADWGLYCRSHHQWNTLVCRIQCYEHSPYRDIHDES